MSTTVIRIGNKKLYCVTCPINITRDELGQYERWCTENIGLSGWYRQGREFRFEERHYAFIFAIRSL
jgi:hypothetical protein